MYYVRRRFENTDVKLSRQAIISREYSCQLTVDIGRWDALFLADWIYI